MTQRILNTGRSSTGTGADTKTDKLSAQESLDLSRTIQRIVKRVKGEYTVGEFVDYTALRSSDLYKEFQTSTLQLVRVDLHSYTETQRKAFFINVYNTLTIHGIVSMDELPDSVLKVRQFWKNTCYKIGDHVFSLDDIEHGILRANSSHPASTEPTYFPKDDVRVQYAAKELDPRLHCALNCGAKSCPAISSYSDENLDTALDLAAKNFCQQEIIVLPKNEEVFVSKIFEWYERDFGVNDIEAIRWALPYMEKEKRSELVILLQGIVSCGTGRIIYNEYDWGLNKTFR